MIRFLVAVALLVALPVAAQADTAQDHPLKDFHPKLRPANGFCTPRQSTRPVSFRGRKVSCPALIWRASSPETMPATYSTLNRSTSTIRHEFYCEQHPKDGYDFAVQNVYRNRPLVTGSAALFQARPRN